MKTSTLIWIACAVAASTSLASPVRETSTAAAATTTPAPETGPSCAGCFGGFHTLLILPSFEENYVKMCSKCLMAP